MAKLAACVLNIARTDTCLSAGRRMDDITGIDVILGKMSAEVNRGLVSLMDLVKVSQGFWCRGREERRRRGSEGG